jgi:hypothetical protein
MILHGATCTNIITSPEGSRAVGVDLRTVSNRSCKIFAPTIVLACGGLETARLLLASRESRSCGLGNDHDLVGRFYMTHLVGHVGHLRFANAKTGQGFEYGLTPDGVYGRRLIRLSASARRRETIGNIDFRPDIPAVADASHRDPVLSAMFIAKRFITPEYRGSLIAESTYTHRGAGETWRYHGANVIFGLPRLIGFGIDWLRRRTFARRKLPSVFLYRADGNYPLQFVAEQFPNFESRVLLGSETDPFGVPRLVVQWRTAERDIVSVCRAHNMLAAAVAKSGFGTVQLNPDLQSRVRSIAVPVIGHHIGTARMGLDPRAGVVDANAEVWGTRGLFVAGSAIFTTSGSANPTLTAVALALRLAEHLVRRRKVAATEVRLRAAAPDFWTAG